MNKLNMSIRSDICEHIAVFGETESRTIIDIYSAKYQTSRQRISGNLTTLLKIGALSINRNYPHSTLF